MEYSKDIIINAYSSKKERGQAKIKESKIIKLYKKHKIIATMCAICGILILLDCILVYNFVELLQTIA